MAVPDAGIMTGHGHRQQGVALITALLMVALAVVAATAMATRLQIDIRRTANLLHGEQAYAYALSAESWAEVILRRDAKDSSIDALDEDWASSLPPIAVQGGLVTGHVTDLQGRFNVNDMVDNAGKVDKLYFEYFQRLLEVLGLDPQLAAALLDWIDEDINATFPGGAEDDAYLLLDPPYRAANHRLADISELRLVQGFTPEVVEKLLPHVTALPDVTFINVNTASAPVLQALSAKITAMAVQQLLEIRDHEPFPDPGHFLASDPLAGADIPLTLAVNSNWFGVDIEVVVGGGRARILSVLERNGPKLRVRQRSRVTGHLLPTG